MRKFRKQIRMKKRRFIRSCWMNRLYRIWICLYPKATMIHRMSVRAQNRRRLPLFRSKASRARMIGLELALMEFVDPGGGDLERKAVALATIRTTSQCIILFSLLPLIYSYVSFTVGFVGKLIGFCSFGNFKYTGWRDAIDGRWITLHELQFIQESIIRASGSAKRKARYCV